MPHPDLKKGLTLFLIACFLLAVLGILVKNLSNSVPTELITFWQFFILWLGTLPILLKAGLKKNLRSYHPNLIAIRALSGVAAYFFFFHALSHIPLIDAVLLMNSAPLYLPIIAYFWGRKRFPAAVWIGILIGFAGVVVILRPGQNIFQASALVGVMSGIFSGIAMIAIRRSEKFDHPTTLLFYYGLLGTVVFSPWVLTAAPNYSEIIWLQLIAVGLVMLAMQYLVALSFEYASAVVLGPISYTSIIFSGLLAWAIWGRVPDLWTVWGTVLVVAGAITTIRMSRSKT